MAFLSFCADCCVYVIRSQRKSECSIKLEQIRKHENAVGKDCHLGESGWDPGLEPGPTESESAVLPLN